MVVQPYNSEGVTSAGSTGRCYITKGLGEEEGRTGKHRGVKRKWWDLAHSPRMEGKPPDTEENPVNQYRKRLGGQTRPQRISYTFT